MITEVQPSVESVSRGSRAKAESCLHKRLIRCRKSVLRFRLRSRLHLALLAHIRTKPEVKVRGDKCAHMQCERTGLLANT
jgi:hypothetical protein